MLDQKYMSLTEVARHFGQPYYWAAHIALNHGHFGGVSAASYFGRWVVTREVFEAAFGTEPIRLMRPKEVAGRLGRVSASHTLRTSRDGLMGGVPTIRLGKRLYVDAAKFEAAHE